MKILLVTDAWKPQVNGVVRTIEATINVLTQQGHQVKTITPEFAKTIPCPTYSEIPLTFRPMRHIRESLLDFQPDAIHISTEGPLGWCMRGYCKKHDLNFTTSFHTRFPEYVSSRVPIPLHWSYNLLRKFHSLASAVMVNTPSMRRDLWLRGFQHLRRWSRGVDTEVFRPMPRSLQSSRPKLLYVGRVAVEKNLDAFLDMEMDAEKIVVGGGPLLKTFQKKYSSVHFTGPRFDRDLVQLYSMADAFVFPSHTDTFGLVMLEALACGTPVAAFPSQGPIDVIQSEAVGCLDEDLKVAVRKALGKSRSACREYAKQFSWGNCTHQFVNNLVQA